MKKSLNKKSWVLLIVAFFVAIIISGCGETATPKVVPTSGETTPVEKEEAPVEENQEFKVGEQIQLGDNAIKVVSVEKSQGSEFDKPKSGQEYVIVTVEIENKGSENITYNPFDFKMSNSQGQVIDQTFTTISIDTSLSSGELAPNGKVSGTIPFEMPVGDTKLQLQYSPSFWTDDTVIINLQ